MLLTFTAPYLAGITDVSGRVLNAIKCYLYLTIQNVRCGVFPPRKNGLRSRVWSFAGQRRRPCLVEIAVAPYGGLRMPLPQETMQIRREPRDCMVDEYKKEWRRVAWPTGLGDAHFDDLIQFTRRPFFSNDGMFCIGWSDWVATVIIQKARAMRQPELANQKAIAIPAPDKHCAHQRLNNTGFNSVGEERRQLHCSGNLMEMSDPSIHVSLSRRWVQVVLWLQQSDSVRINWMAPHLNKGFISQEEGYVPWK